MVGNAAAVADGGSVAAVTSDGQGEVAGGVAGSSPLVAASALAATPLVDSGRHAGSDGSGTGGAMGSGSLPPAGNTDAAAAALSASGAAASTSPSGNAAAVTPTLPIHAALDSGEFPQEMAQRVSWMVDNGVNGAKLQVNPPQLGPIELSISVQGDHAQVSMITHSALTREALESSTPKLREMLGAQGFAGVSVDISQRSFQERSPYSPPYERLPAAAALPGPVTPVTTTAPMQRRSGLSGLDTYA